MTVSALTNRNDYIGNGNVDTYAYGFKIFADTELLVTVRDTDDVETELTLTTHYTVTGVGSASGGNVVLVGTSSFDWIDADGDLESGYVLTIKRNPALKQLTDIRNQGAFFPESHENQFDKLVMIDQKQQDEIDRSAKLPVTIDPDDVDMTLPVPVAGQFIAWNSAGDGLENQSMDVTTTEYPGTFTAGADASKAASPTAKDIYLATDTLILYACFSSGTWKVINTISGLDASKAASPKAGQTYIATDTGKVYHCFVAGTWTTALTLAGVLTMSAASIIRAMGANVTSAATTNIWTTDGDTIHIAGATGPITSFGTAPQAGAIKHIIFDSTPTLTHNATSLILPGAANIVAAAGDSAIVLALTTTNMKVLHYMKASGLAVAVAAVATDPFAGQLLHVRDEKAANTAGGTFTSGAWRTRDLNTVKTNEISGASLSANQITLPAGTYYIDGSAPAHACNSHVAKLYNITDASDVTPGTNSRSGNSDDIHTRSEVSGRFTIGGVKVFELQHQCGTTRATDGFGLAANLGVVEVYSDVKIWKVA